MNTKEILKVIVGSQAHGLATPESDYDYRGVFIVPTEEFFKVGKGNIKHTSWIEGTVDATSWELGHFLDLATHCNPTILETFLAPIVDIHGAEWTDEDKIDLGKELRDLFPYIWNAKAVYDAFGGYSHNQQKKFLDKKDTRPHKYASAYLRVLYQGTQLLETGTFPVDFTKTPIYDTLKNWKNKIYTIGEVMTITEEWENKMKQAYEANPHKQANLEPVNEFILKVRKEYWSV